MKTITAAELKNKLVNNEVVLVDVREQAEHQSECIDGACLIPLAEVSLQKLPISSRPIVFHCGSGRRSEEACKKILAQNPSCDVYSLEGGLNAWKKAGFEIKKMGRNTLPLDRQTQIAAGLLAFLGVVLGALLHPAFYALSGFIGLGLMFAGMTGWCGMSKLLAKMPWNN